MTETTSGLEEQRDLLLRSLEDLEAEYRAGDLDQADYEALRDDYTARAAAVLRRIEAPAASSAARPAAAAVRQRSRLPRLVMIGAVVGFAVLVGLLLAQTAGERGVNDQITGAIDASARTRVVRCQELGSSEGDLLGALECFDEVLADDPDNAEALAYRGWYLLLAGGSLQQSAGDSAEDAATADELMASGLAYLDRSIEADPLLPDPLAFRASINDRLGQSDEVCADLATLQALDPPQFFLDQTAALASRNGC